MDDTLQTPGGQPVSRLGGLLRKGRIGFYAAAGIVLAGVLGAGYGLYHLMELRTDYQEQRNTYLKGELVKLEAQLAQLDKPRREAMAIQDMGQSMQHLYNARAMDPGMFNFLAREIPPGVQLTYAGLDQGKLTLRGVARSPGEVDGLMHAIGASPWLDNARLVSSAEREEGGRRLQTFVIGAKAGYFRKPVTGSSGKPDGEAQKAANAAPSSPVQPAPERKEAPAQSVDENTVAWAATGLAIGLSLLVAGWLVRRWRGKRAASAGQRAPFSVRSAAQFDALDPHDVSTWGLIPRMAVLFELAVVAGVAAWFVLDAAWDNYSDAVMVEEKLKARVLQDNRSVVNLDLILAGYSHVKQAYAPVIHAFPARVDGARFEAGIRDAARKAGVSLVRANRESKIAGGMFPGMPVSVRVVGSFDGIGAFVGRVVKLNGVVALHSFDLVPDEPGGKGGKNMKLRLNATLASHAYDREVGLAKMNAVAKK